jgi:hypothetical protein
MNKELTPLQALDNIIETFIDKDSEDIKTVRTALKEYEYEKEQHEYFAKQFEDYKSAYHTQKYELEQVEKKLKALEILKRYVYKIEKYNGCSGTEYWIFFDGMESENNDLSKEEYELLKEVLK